MQTLSQGANKSRLGGGKAQGNMATEITNWEQKDDNEEIKARRERGRGRGREGEEVGEGRREREREREREKEREMKGSQLTLIVACPDKEQKYSFLVSSH